MQLKKVDETTYQVWDQEETTLLFTGDMKACDDFMLEEIRKKVDANPDWFIEQLKTFDERLKIFKSTIEDIINQQKNNNNDSKNDNSGENSVK
jgi:hypothetical protein